MTITEEQAERIKHEFEKSDGPISKWAQQCHAASLALVRSGLLGEGGTVARVARGTLYGVPGQHSWAVVGDPYEPDLVVDLTAWSYHKMYPEVYVVNGIEAPHIPHGAGSIWEWGVPECGNGPDIELDTELSDLAQAFIRLVAGKHRRKGLDRRGWSSLFNGPMQGWPSKEIISAAAEMQSLRPLIPIDIVGMLTDRNPENVYW